MDLLLGLQARLWGLTVAQSVGACGHATEHRVQRGYLY